MRVFRSILCLGLLLHGSYGIDSGTTTKSNRNTASVWITGKASNVIANQSGTSLSHKASHIPTTPLPSPVYTQNSTGGGNNVTLRYLDITGKDASVSGKLLDQASTRSISSSTFTNVLTLTPKIGNNSTVTAMSSPRDTKSTVTAHPSINSSLTSQQSNESNTTLQPRIPSQPSNTSNITSQPSVTSQPIITMDTTSETNDKSSSSLVTKPNTKISITTKQSLTRQPDQHGISSVFQQLLQGNNFDGNVLKLMNANVSSDLFGALMSGTQSNRNKLIQQLLQTDTYGKLGDLFIFGTNNIRIGGLHRGDLQKLIDSPIMQTLIQQALQNGTDIVMSVVKEILMDESIDRNLTDTLQELYGNETGTVGKLVEVLPLVLQIRHLLKPATLSSTDQCTADIAAYLQGLRSSRLWALTMLDASGKPVKSMLKGARRFLGNYDQCLEIAESMTTGGHQHTVRGQYWTLLFTLPPNVTEMLTFNTGLPQQAGGQTFQWDLCLPSSCDISTVTDAIQEIPLHWFGIALTQAAPVTMDDWRDDGSAVAAVVIMALITTLTVIGTSYDVISGWLAKSTSYPDGESEVNGYANKSFVSDDGKRIRHVSTDITMIAMNGIMVYPPDEPDSDDEEEEEDVDKPQQSRTMDAEMRKKTRKSQNDSNQGFGRQLLLSFSLSKNTEKIFSTKTGESNLGCIHGIRVLSMAWVILGHTLWWSQSLKYENPVDYYKVLPTFTGQGIVAGTLAVDTFFLLSGCLVCYLFLRETKKSKRQKPTVKQMAVYYIHRYWRVPFCIAVLTSSSLSARDAMVQCISLFATIRLTPVYMIIMMLFTCLLPYLMDGPLSKIGGNAFGDSCPENWWINLLYINNVYKAKEMCFGWSWFLANDMQFYIIAPLALLPIGFGFHVIGVVVMVLLFAVHIISYGYIEYQLGGASSFINVTSGYLDRIYMVPWCRVGPFAIGLILGYILHKTKCKAILPRYALVIGWQTGIAIGLLCSYVTYDDWKDGVGDWPRVSIIAYETLFRPGWALCVSWIIFACCTGNGGVINSVLSWNAWQPLGRLTYGAYLIHPILLSYTEFSVRSLVYYNTINISYHFIGTFVISYALAYITCVLVESPCMGLEKAVLNKLKLKR